MRRAILEIPESAMIDLLLKWQQDGEIHAEVVHGLPEDAKFMACQYVFERKLFQIMFESSEFADIDEYDRIPILPRIQFTRIDYVIPQYEP